MPTKDHHGIVLSGANSMAAEFYRFALNSYHCYAGDAPGFAEAAIDVAPDFLMAHVLKAYMNLIGGTAEQAQVGVAAFETARRLPATSREQGHLAALDRLLAGEIRAAARILEDVSIACPRDSLALLVGQNLDFLLGDSRMMRDRIARAMPAWSRDTPDYHAMLGMYAFGLEEMGDYARAEAAGREAVALQPRNNWAQHAVAHVLEMEDRREEGVAWMTQDGQPWVEESFFAIHNWWHLALFHIGLGDTEAALELFDGPIFGPRSGAAFDMIDAAALLWRLSLRGVVVGQARWDAVADVFETQPAGGYAFTDAHRMMALVSAGREDAARELLDLQAAALEAPGDNAMFVREAGLAVSRAVHAFGHGDYARAVELLRGVRNQAARFGGSHAQRDLLDQTLIVAAGRAGEHSLEQALLAERRAAKPLVRREGRRLAA
ncbi:tetratricopeptide repeat protein [Phenylobacterium sp.]|uniref:tetratricopeptide repeat protein n=1 Tax=Phenylobacterium sp. TaxID=1871053 RepID=UPI0035B3FBC3